MKNIFTCLCLLLVLASCKDQNQNREKQPDKITPAATKTRSGDVAQKNPDSIPVIPVEHASFMMELGGKNLYFDPVGGSEKYKDMPEADAVFITDIHSDHFDLETLSEVVADQTILFMPKAVLEKLSDNDDLPTNIKVLNNGELATFAGIKIEAIPMYNLREEAKEFHPKGRGNGYVLSFDGKRVYVAGDTEDIPEMRSLKNIDLAFIPMNMPYTMPVEEAADAVLAFKPKKVYPYHYRGEKGFSDVAEFKNIVETNKPEIDVQLLNWYPNR